VVIKLNVDMSKVQRAIHALASEGGNQRKLLAALKQPLKKDQAAHGRAMEGPESKWKPRAPSTVLRARKQKGRRRVKGANRRLLASLPRRTVKVKSSGRRLIAFSKVPWAGIHQHGGATGKGHRSRIPARPFLWFSDEFMRGALRTARLQLVKAWLTKAR
jgi:phage gpG-like protein